ncbi:sensor histidine kinase [Chitinophaga solisilvae]|uniref:sensor histidine kinase n=1 Tax=Chitinophaga solisilvae TaxID=1233460 RepID=UPI00136A6346|nr:HAMP domain-containing sensor histidine kinase [Chitinophaga solisilvae]
MDAIIKRIWWIVVPTALAVLAFQLYWLRSSWRSQEDSFTQVASDALAKARDRAVVESVKKIGNATDSSFKLSSSVSINSDSYNDYIDSLMKQNDQVKVFKKVIKSPADSLHLSGKKDTVIQKNIDPIRAGLDMTQFLASVFVLSDFTRPDTALLAKKYREELKNRHILLPFQLTIYNKDTTITKAPGVIALGTPHSGNPMLVVARFPGLNSMLLLKILWPIILSFLLVLLIIGCIWTLWRIIVRQKKLEVMKNDFISNITHELKTPVAILSATNEALLAFGGINDPEKTARYLRLGQDEIRKLQGLVDNIMALTRLEHGDDDMTGEMAAIAPADLLKAVVSRFTGLPGVHIDLDTQLQQETILTYPAALKTIFSNLVDNAIKYTATPEKRVVIQVRETEQYIIFFIKDQGMGIDKQHQPFIFDRFYRVPHGDIHEVKGHGLGLSHVKSLVTRLNGTITVESTPGQGTTFIIQLKKS